MSKWRRYFKGRKAEYRTINFLKKNQGYEYVFRTAGSHGPIDVIAVSSEPTSTFLFIQVKAGKVYRLSKEEDDALTRLWLACMVGHSDFVRVEVWYWGPRARTPAIKKSISTIEDI